MKRLLKRLKAFTTHPATQLTTGLILLISGGSEVVLDFIDAERTFFWGAHHGVALFGLLQMLGSLPEVVDGLNKSFGVIEKGREEPSEHQSSQNEHSHEGRAHRDRD
jgi:hypothetical protein